MRDVGSTGRSGARDVEMVPVSEPLPGDSPRVRGEDATHVENLVNTRDPLPPIVVHRATMRVIDGMHRLKAAKVRGDREIAVEYFDGSAQDAFLRAVRENAAHGLPLSRADRAAAVRRIIEADAGMSDRAIARVVGLSPPTIAAIRRRSTDKALQSNNRLGRDGRTRPLTAAEGRLRAGRLIAERPDASLRAIARDAEISLGTVQDVRKRMDRGEDLIPAKFRTPPVPPCPEGTVGERDAGLPALHLLRRDPSLRLSETGRALLQWLGVCARQHEREQIVNAIPEHCVEIILELAASCAESWTQLRHDLERRTRSNAVDSTDGWVSRSTHPPA